ncbi:GAP family protein [Maribacter aestuarii]|uniref:GAP family protein n=1 Tax=Maribacter aestuarii TaxID=1130723 RepID=UPI00248AFCEB|nr:GAP family protein [Maribacter aestuarii]
MADVAILPLALSVMLGPQILVGMLLITRKDPIKSSLIYITAIILTLILTTYMYYSIIQRTDLHMASFAGVPMLKYFLIILFIVLIIRSLLKRHQVTAPPKWMQGIATASLGKIFMIGLCLIAFMPTDIAVTFSIGSILNSASSSFLEAWPFFGAVLFISFLPLIIYFSLGSNGSQYLEKVNRWLNTHGYIINIIVFTFFIFLLI